MALTRAERDELIRRAIEADEQRFPEDQPGPTGRAKHLLDEAFYSAVADYFDGLPRVVMSACPYCGEPLVRSFDPWGFDGVWWGDTAIYKAAEPPACDHFRVLQGAVRIPDTAVPARVVMDSQPGPDVPFVIPRLLELANMIAVVGELAMEVGGPAYPIAYFSDQSFEPRDLHQEWRRTMLWFQRDGRDLWTASNDAWDFDLQPWIDRGKLRWVLLGPGVERPALHPSGEGDACPFVALPGQREPQAVFAGGREYLDLPDGEAVNPFEEDGGA
jgi:hypothetical protein